MARARVRVSERLDRLLRSDWERAIHEAALGVEDTRIAELYLLDAVAQIDIGAELCLSRSAISKRLLRITDKVERTAERLGMLE